MNIDKLKQLTPSEILAYGFLIAFVLFGLTYTLLQEEETTTSKPIVVQETPEELENRLKEEIRKLDEVRKSEISSIEGKIEYYNKCIKSKKKDIGTTKPLRGCDEIDFESYSSGATLVPIADAAELEPLPVTEIKKERKWRVNSQGDSKKFEELGGTTMEEVLRSHNLFDTYHHWVELEKQYKVKKEVPLCIAWADSSLGKQLKTKNNFGNVGNNDRGDRVHYATKENGIEAIFKVLNNKYLSHKQSVGSLSVGGGGDSPYYATSKENWNNNVLNCLSVLYKTDVTEDFMFRRN